MWSALLLLWAAVAGTPAAPKLKIDYDIRPVEATGGCYPSGLQVVAIRRPGTGTATAVWVVNAGRASDPAGLGGSMHMLEHLWFRSHPEKGEPYLMAAAELDPGANTLVDATVFRATASAAELGPMLKLHSWLLASPLYGVTEEVVDAERDIVKHEAWYRGAHGGRAALRMLDRSLFPPDHPYHAERGGPEELDAITLESLSDLSKTAMVPKGATLYIEADLPLDEMNRLVQENLPGRLTNGPGSDCSIPRTENVPDKPATTKLLHLKGPRWRPAVYFGWAVPPMGAESDLLLELAATQLKMNIYQEMSGVPGLKQYDSSERISCSPAFGRLSTRFRCIADLPAGIDPTQVVAAIRRGLRDAGSAATQDYDSHEEVAWSSNALRMSWLAEAESQTATAVQERALFAHNTGSVELHAARMAGMVALKHEEIADFIDRWLSADRMAAVYVEPAGGPTLAMERIGRQPKLEAHERHWKPAASERPVEVRTLENGLEVWTIQRANGSVGYADLVFEGGSMREPVPGTSEVIDYMARYSMPAVDFRDLTFALSQSSRHAFGNWSASFSTTGTAGNVDAQLWTMRAMYEGQTWDPSDRQNALDLSAAASLRLYGHEPATFTGPAAYHHLFGDHRAGMSWWEWNKAARAVRENEVRSWQAQTYRPERGTLIVVSDRAGSDLREEVDRYFGRMKGRGKLEPLAEAIDAPPGPPPARKAFAFEANKITSTVSTRCRVPGPGPDTAAATDVLRVALYEALFQTLRSEGGTYTPSVDVYPFTPDVAVLRLEALVAPIDAGNAAAAMLAVLEALGSGKHDDFVSAAVAKARADWGRRWASADGAASIARHAATWGHDAGRLSQRDAELAAIDAQVIAKTLADCVQHEAVTVIGTDAGKHLEGAGLDVETVDWRARLQEVLTDLE